MSANGRKLFLGGLTKTTTTEQLFEAFGKFGQVVDAVVMERNGNPRGFGFVTYKEKSSLNGALATGVTIDGRLVDVKRAVPEEEMDFCPSKVFVGGLSQNVDKTALKRHFETFGEVRDAVVMMDRTTSRSRGFGFVRFAAPDAVEAVLRTPHLLDGQWIDVKRAQPAEQLPPPKFPRAREEAQKKTGRQGRQSGKPAQQADPSAGMYGGMPTDDSQFAASAASWAMWNLMMQGPGGANPFFPQFPVAPAASNVDISTLLSSMNLGVATGNDMENIPKQMMSPMKSPLGDLSNMFEPTSPTKSPMKSPLGMFRPQASPVARKASPLLDITSQLQAATLENAIRG